MARSEPKSGYRGVKYVPNRSRKPYYVALNLYIDRFDSGREAQECYEVARETARDLKLVETARRRFVLEQDYSTVGDWRPEDEEPDSDERIDDVICEHCRKTLIEAIRNAAKEWQPNGPAKAVADAIVKLIEKQK